MPEEALSEALPYVLERHIPSLSAEKDDAKSPTNRAFELFHWHIVRSQSHVLIVHLIACQETVSRSWSLSSGGTSTSLP
jgi:hypothetical protein